MPMSREEKDEMMDFIRKSNSWWRTSGIAIVAGVIGGSISLVAEQIIGDTKDVLGWNLSLVEAEEGITLSSEEGRYIFAGGSSLTPYNLILNSFAAQLDDAGYSGYGYVAPGGSSINLRTVNSGSYPLAFAEAQADVYTRLHAEGELNDTTVIMNTNIPECAFIVGEFETFNHIAIASEQAMMGNRDPIVIGMPNLNSGSYITAENLVQTGLDPEGIELRNGYVDTGVLMDAYERGDVDVAIFVQYPASIDGAFRSGMQRAIQQEYNLVAMDPFSYRIGFRDSPYGYNLLNVELPNPNYARQTTNASLQPRTYDLPMLCTEILIASQSIDSMTDIVTRGQAINLHSAVNQKIGPTDLQFDDMPDFEVLYRSNNPVQTAWQEASLAPFQAPSNDTDFAQSGFDAIRPEETLPNDANQIEYAWVENEESLPAQTL